MPKVSVVIPAYNAAQFVRETLDSVLAQTFRDFEIIVVDDGSKDDTAAIVESFNAPQVRCLRKTNGGVSTARNFGIAESSGEYIALLDADDVWETTKLERQVALLDAKPNVGLCFVGMQRVDAQTRLLSLTEAFDYEDFTMALLLYSCVVSGSCSSVMIRRDVFAQTDGFDSRFSTAADWEFWLRLSLITKFAPVPEFLVKYRILANSMSRNPATVKRDTIGVLDKFFANPDLPAKYQRLKAKSYSNNLLIVSGEFLHNGQIGESLKCMIAALRHQPSNISRPLGMPLRWTKRLLANA